jgi:anti-sigma factor RsiW
MRPDCIITEDDINALVDNELTGREQRRVAAHVASCPECSVIAGGALAAKRMLGVRMQPVDPPAASWQTIASALDEVDQVAHATFQPSARPFWRRMPVGAAIGIALMLGAVAMHLNRTVTPSQDAFFARAHSVLAMNTLSSGARNTQDVVTPSPGGVRWDPVARSLMSVNGEIVEQTLFRVDRAPISQFVMSAAAFDRRRHEKVDFGGRRYYVGVSQQGSLVAWESRGIITALVARTDPRELIALASGRQARTPITGGM